MCGRFTQRLSWNELVARMRLEGPPRPLRPRYNLAPGQEAAVLRLEQGAVLLAMLRWGLVPGWAKAPSIGSRLIINARVETAANKSAFRAAWEARRCVVPANGFYEWHQREPWLFAPRDGSIMALAGLWERWSPPGGLLPGGEHAVLETFTILTTEANVTVRPVHGRMPVILVPETIESWLAGAAMPLGPTPDAQLAAWPVSQRVNDPRHDDPACASPLRETELLLPLPESGETRR